MCESRYYVRLEEKQKNKKLFDLLDTLEFNQAGAVFSRCSKCLEQIFLGWHSHSDSQGKFFYLVHNGWAFMAFLAPGGDLCIDRAKSNGLGRTPSGAVRPWENPDRILMVKMVGK